MVKIVARNGFNRHSANELSALDTFILDYLARCYFNTAVPETVFYLEDNLPILNWNTPPTNIGAEHIRYIVHQLRESALIELEVSLREEIAGKILTKDGCISNNLPTKKIAKHYFVAEEFGALEARLENILVNNKGTYWRKALPEDFVRELTLIKANKLISVITQVIAEARRRQMASLNVRRTNIESWLTVVQRNHLGQLNRMSLNRLSDNGGDGLARKIVNILFCVIHGYEVGSGYFLVEHPDSNEETQRRVINHAKEQLVTKLFVKRNLILQLNILPAVYLEQQPPTSFSYSTVLPANYRFPNISNTQELFAVFKLTDVAIKRYYKFLARQIYFAPNLKIAHLKKLNNRNKLINVETSILGQEYCYHYPLAGLSSTSITYTLSNYGVVNLKEQAFGSYKTIAQRFNTIQQQIPDLTNMQVAHLLQQVLQVNAAMLVDQQIAPFLKMAFIQLLTGTMICLFMVEGFRNPASFVTHALTLERIQQGLSLKKALLDEFPMAPEGSTGVGRETHLEYVTSSNIFHGTDPKGDEKAFKQRERRSIQAMSNKYGFFKEVQQRIKEFWQPATKFAETKSASPK